MPVTQQTKTEIDPFFYRLSGQTRSALVNAGVNCVESLSSMSEEELLHIRGIGQKRKDEVLDLLEELDLPSDRSYTIPTPESRQRVSPALAALIKLCREDSKYWQRGVELLRDNRVLSMRENDEGHRFTVQGTKKYHVRLRPEAEEWDCECPVQPFWGPCKHVIASTLYLAERRRREQLEQREQKKSRLSRLQKKLKTSASEPNGLSTSRSIHYLLTRDYEGNWRIVAHKGPDEPTSPVSDLPRVQYDEIDNPSLPGDAVDRTVLERLSLDYSRNSELQTGEAPSPMGDVIYLLTGKNVWLQESSGIERRLDIREQSLAIKLELAKRRNGQGSNVTGEGPLELTCRIEGEEVSMTPDSLEIICRHPLWVLHDDTLFPVHGNRRESGVLDEFSKGPIRILSHQMETFCGKIFPRLEELNVDVVVDPGNFPRAEMEPEGRIYLSEQQNQLIIRFTVAYGGIQVSNWSGDHVVVPDRENNSFRLVPRDREEEERLKQQLERSSVRRASFLNDDTGSYTPTGDPIEWLVEDLGQLTEKGFTVYGQDRLDTYSQPRSPSRTQLDVASGIDWFEMSGSVEYGDEDVSLAELREALQSNQSYVELSSGEYGKIPEQWVEAFSDCLNMGRTKGERIQMPEAAAPLVDEMTQKVDEAQVDDGFRDTLQTFRSFEEIEDVDPPEQFQGTLRSYQQAGLSWMMFLREFGVGGLLADDMGLGKTIQVLALFLKIKEETGAFPFSLVVAPRSVLTNWRREANRFVPGLDVYTHHGLERASNSDQWPDAGLNITTYGTMRQDIEWMNDMTFDYVVLDESQAIRNPDTKTAKAVKTLDGRYRLCLSGTPVQNTTLDLWSQFEFLNPGYLGPRSRFEETFVRGIEAENEERISDKLRKLVDPFLLRRTKGRVEKELPPVSQSQIECPMDTEQKHLYERIRRVYKQSIEEDREKMTENEVRFKTLEGLTRLRQICCHPNLVDEDLDESAKLREFRRSAKEVIQEGHRILVFSQFVEFLQHVKQVVRDMGWSYEYLDGQTRNRQERVDRFQSDESISIFLISLKAGGEGLNLTGADYVFLMDPWWNPAVERQATDRTHRIGQDERVFVYRFICPETVEEDILELAGKSTQARLSDPELLA